MPSSHFIIRVFVFVDYANKLSLHLNFFYVCQRMLRLPRFFLFQILIEERQRLISILISTGYPAYHDAFWAGKTTQRLPFPFRGLKSQFFDSRRNP